MGYRILKFFTVTAHLLLLWLLYQFAFGKLDINFVSGCLVLSGFWFGFTVWRLERLLDTYFSYLSRMQVLVPLVGGLFLSGAAIWNAGTTAGMAIAGVELVLWLGVYARYRYNSNRFVVQGHGPLPKGAWINPPAEALEPGDMILTGGRMAGRVKASVGHGELVIIGRDGEVACLSSYMEAGTVINNIQRVTKGTLKVGHYIALRLKQPLTPCQLKKLTDIAEQMLAENIEWRTAAKARFEKTVNRLWAPAFVKTWLRAKFTPTGYDYRGLFVGVSRKHAWTCVGGVLEAFKRVGIPMKNWGTGFFGIGTGFLDPIVPVRFLSEPKLRLLTADDKAAFEKRTSISS